ncbi:MULTISPECIES: class I SAM-dependent methyltransferase [unclassified Sphingomonas]|uniref:class I SAM-dependent methyltransferase n=1 Tax=unclassified Sphingomonas TaxID=196159 RepID=UPI0006F71B1B|nr:MULTISPECIES: methyltransferase domain-containing protein [unclassified Sphingomonas]KQX18104.1 SAM-dependent methyltransferase [Sphingomonas sp. Root1294]KQY72659.1 SAM-dependent methyltransferase [Sphingomonas sp. Root50]KRB87715.1 SAM-dependent methyltransferase [Sphingomonas sp. Root720]
MNDDIRHNDRIISQFTRWAQPFADLPIHAEEDGMGRTLAAAAIGPADHVLDVACGPGIVACAAAAHAAHVTGIDLTPAMIEQARARQAAAGLANLDWRTGDATALPFADDSFDRVVTRYSFHHLREPGRALAEMRRVCRPGGRVVVIDATPAPECQAAYDRMETLRDPSHSSALTVEQLRGLGRAAALTELSVDSYRLEALLSTLADADDMAALDAMFDADIAEGKDRIGVQARRTADGIRFHFPISIVAWHR